ncbi:MAG: hypothetical protein GY774_35870 [Planctomycetes bacterium]|nr:hypothetical protein [Planctomycetota bacterium]
MEREIRGSYHIMFTRYTKTIITMFLGAILFIPNSPLLAQDAYIAQFGVTKGKSVDKGFVFIDGQYLESPYIVSRRGLAIYVNNKQILNPTRHPGKQPLIIKENPERISTAEREKIFRALEATQKIYEKYLGRNYGYLFSSKGGHLKLFPHTVAYAMPVVVECLTSSKPRDEKLQELLPHNWHLHIDVDTFIDNFRITPQLMPRLKHLAEELLEVEEYGSMRDAPIDKGFIFIGGKYIEAPYRVERRGLGIFINNLMIQQPYYIPKKIYPGNINPPMPEEITSESSINDEIVSVYLSQKHAFVQKHKTEINDLKVMEQAYKSLPFVIEAKLDEKNPRTLHIKTNEGLDMNVSLVSFVGRRGTKYDRISVINRIDPTREHFQKTLEEGACHFFKKNGGRISLSAGSAFEKLPRIMNILHSEKTAKQKLQEFQKAKINLSNQIVRELISNYSACHN